MPSPSTIRSTSLTPAFTGASLDRVADLRGDRAELERFLHDPRAVVLGASTDSVLITEDPQPSLLRRPLEGRVNPYQPILLGVEDGRPLFGADLDDPEAQGHLEETGVGRLVTLRDAGLLLSQTEGGLAAYLVALLNWHRRHKFCSVCGSPTRVAEAGLSRRCPSCRASHFPRTDPVVIMLVEHEGHVLLGRRVGWPAGRFSILAGFVSPGETPEEAVVREVHEESGIIAHSPRYMASQPWPFPSSLMLGYEASGESGEPVPQPGEMIEVRWWSRGEIASAQRGTGDLKLPGEVSIARMLIDAWIARGGRRL
jgi:NAD+ diphosphatase